MQLLVLWMALKIDIFRLAMSIVGFTFFVESKNWRYLDKLFDEEPEDSTSIDVIWICMIC